MAFKKPKNMDELLNTFYGSDQARKAYTNNIKTKLLAPHLEKEGLELLSCLGRPNRIPRSERKTFDYKIPESNVLAEITSIDMPQETTFNLNADLKIEKAVRHLGEKDSTEHANYIRGGIIYYSPALAHLCSELSSRICDRKVIGDLMKANNLQYLILIPEATSMMGKSSRDIFPSIVYASNSSVMSKFEGLPTNIRKKTVPAGQSTIDS